MIRSRRAVSLIELLVILSACTVVLTLTSALLCRAMRIQMQSRAHVDVERAALRLSEQFRHDVHQARAAVTNKADLGGKAFLRLQFADGQQAEYSDFDGTVLRLVSENGSQISREEFTIPAACKFTIQEEGTPPRLVLTIYTKPDEAPAGDDKPLVRAPAIPVSLQAEASLGRDFRFAGTPAGQEAAE